MVNRIVYSSHLIISCPLGLLPLSRRLSEAKSHSGS